MSYLELSNPTSDSCDYEIELSSAFNQNYYKQVRLTTTDYGASILNVSSYVVYKNAPSSGTSKYVRGIIDDGMSAGRTYRFYAYAQAANGTWYKAGMDIITMEDEDEKFDYGFRSVDVESPAPYMIGNEVEICAQIKNYLNTAGPRYLIEVRDRGGKIIDRVSFAKINAKKTVDVYFYTTLKAEQVQNNKISYTLKIKADASGWVEQDNGDNEDTIDINITAPIAPTRIYDDVNVTDSLSSGEKWYYVIFNEDGKANFALQPKKSSLDVDLAVYASNQTTRLGRTAKLAGQDDIVSDISVVAGERYYIRVNHYEGNGNYTLRCKNYPTNSDVMNKLQNDTSLGLTQEKKNTLIKMGSVLLASGFELGFAAGVLGNILHEANVGTFESSAYISNPSAQPAYLKYVDEHFDYRNKFSAKNIKDVGIKATKELVDKCANVNYQGKFGLGCVQWTGGRTMNLVDCYINVCGATAFPTSEQCYEAEGTLISNELNGAYNHIYDEWLTNYKNNTNAAYEAGSIVCRKYEIPAGYNEKAITRGNSAQKIYDILIK